MRSSASIGKPVVYTTCTLNFLYQDARLVTLEHSLASLDQEVKSLKAQLDRMENILLALTSPSS